jgi:hypothetical protein
MFVVFGSDDFVVVDVRGQFRALSGGKSAY